MNPTAEPLSGGHRRWSLQHRADQAAKWIATLMPIALVLPTAWLSIGEVLLLASWLLAGRYAERYRCIRANPVALVALALFGLLLVGTLYSRADWSASLDTVDNYLVLLFIPIIVSVYDDSVWRDRALVAVLAGVAVILLVVYLRWMGLLPPAHGVRMAFKNHITEGLMLSFGSFLIAHKITISPSRRWWWSIALIALLVPLFFLYGSKSGYIVFAALFVLFFWQRFGWRAVIPAPAMLFAAAMALWFVSDTFRVRVDDGLQGFAEYRPGVASDSVGVRIEYYKNSLLLIEENPLAGVGTGGFTLGYREIVEGMDLPPILITENPHNQYLLLAAELGVGGAILFLLLLSVQWAKSFHLNRTSRHIAQGVVVAMGVGCLFNSVLLDFTDGAWFGLMSGIVFSGLNQWQT